MDADHTFDVAVVGAGVFGAWTAYQLHRAGATVALLDAHGTGHSRSSSGGESRIVRLGYGPDEIYTRSAQRSLTLWQDFFDLVRPDSKPQLPPLFQRTGVLWLAHENDPYCESTLATLARVGARFEKLERADLQRRYPQLDPGPIAWGILEPDSGVLMARRALQSVVTQARTDGVVYLEEAILPPKGNGKLNSIATLSGKEISAANFVFACGPWLPKVFPETLRELIHVTRQEVFFFGPPAGDGSFSPERFPAWIDFGDLVYGLPNLDKRGLKMAIDAHGPEFDPENGERVVSASQLTAVRAYLAQRLPRLADAPVTETRVCQYENTSNGDFLIDRHPDFDNLWLLGGGSGHGFKHGPAVGEYVAAMMTGAAEPEPRFALANKEKVQERKIY